MSVAQVLSFTKAAEECHIAQTAMSRHIASLEDELKVVLFYRDNRSVKLTEAGKVFYQEISELMQKYEYALHRTKLAGQGQSGSISIGIGFYERTFVVELMEWFCQEHPGIEVLVSQYKYSELVNQFKRNQLNIIFTHERSMQFIPPETVIACKLFDSEIGILVNRNHVFANMKIVSAAQIEQECIITNSEESGPLSLENFREECATQELFPANVKQTNSLESQILMVEAGLGVALIPAMIKNGISDKTVFLRFDWQPAVQYWAIMQKDNHNQAAGLLMDHIRVNGVRGSSED
jgi:DNA-binding transcriptional LysR family regulator